MKTPSRRWAAGLAALVAASLTFASPAPSRAGIVYGVTFLDNQLVSIDTTTGAGTLIGNLGTTMLPFGLASANGNLYTFDSSADVIRQINPATAGTQATYNIGIGPVLGQGGMAMQNGSVGFLTSALDPSSDNTVNDLYTFNIATGTSKLIAQTSDTLEALAFGPTGVLYALGKLDGDLYTVNTTTGALTLVGYSGYSPGSPTGGLSFGPGGVLYGTFDDTLYTISTATGAASLVNPDPTMTIGFNSISGLAAFPSTVPEPSSIALVAVAAAMAGGHGLARRRRD